MPKECHVPKYRWSVVLEVNNVALHVLHERQTGDLLNKFTEEVVVTVGVAKLLGAGTC